MIKLKLQTARICAASALLATALLVGCASPTEQAAEYYQEGMKLLEQDDLVKARLQFQNALQIVPEMSEATYGLALVAERLGQWERVYALLRRVMEQDPGHLAARVRLGRLLLAAGQLDGALELSDALQATHPQDPEVLSLRAALMFKLDDRAGAAELARTALRADPANTDALVVLASERLAAGDPQAALRLLDEGETRSDNVALQLIRVQALEGTGDLAAAEEALRRLGERHPDSRPLRHLLARFYLKHGRPADAEAVYRAIAEASPADVEARLDIVRFLHESSGSAAAAAELGRQIKADPAEMALRFALAGLHRGQGDADAADRVLEGIVESAAESADRLRAKAQIAGSRLAAGDREGAAELVREVLEADARNQEALLVKARLELDAQRPDQAIADLRAILRDSPGSPNALLLLARAHEATGAPALAEENYVLAFQASRMAAQYGLAYAEYLLRRQRVQRAESVLLNVLKSEPGNLDVLALLAQVRLQRGDWTGAQEVADLLRRDGEGGTLADRIAGTAYAGQKDFEASIGAFRRAHEAAPEEAQPMLALVRAYLGAGRAEEAERFVQSVLKTSPDNGAARLLLGQLQVLKGDLAAAEQSFRTAIARNPDDAAAYLPLAGLLVRQGRLDAVEQTLAEGLERNPDDFGLRMTRASFHELAGRTEEAIAEYESLLKERPEADILVNNLASLLSEHRHDEASLKRAYELARRFEGSRIPHFQDTLGWVNYRLGRHQEAQELLVRASEKLPELGVVRYHLGMNYLALADRQAARRELEQALALDADAPWRELAMRTLQEVSLTDEEL